MSSEFVLFDGGHAPPEPVCLALEPDPVLGFLHLPRAESGRETAVLICPPFGWEEMCSYRGRRRWAQALSDAGYPAARFDLPGTGDSGGSAADTERLEAWTRTIEATGEWLLARTGCRRLAVIGIGLGGMLACRGLARGAAIDDLILWAVPGSGRTLLREMKAYAGIVSARHPADARGHELPEGAAELIGFLLDADTATALENLRLTDLELPSADKRRVLLLGRDRLRPDKRLRAHLEQSGAEVTVADGADYEQLMAHPQEARTPVETIARTISWLGAAPTTGAREPRRTPAVQRESIELSGHGRLVRETPMRFELAGGPTFGVLTEPVDGDRTNVCGVLLNGGALRHVGPNRGSVELARRWATLGVASVRVDLQGIGDAEGDERDLVSNAALYSQRSTADTLAVLDQLAARGLPERFVLAGLCSGAYWALHAARADARVVGALMINLYAFYWSEALVSERETHDSLNALRAQGWWRLVRGEVRASQLRTAARSVRPSRIRSGVRHPVERAHADQIERDLDQLRDQGTEALLLLSFGEPLYDQLARQGTIDKLDRWPNLVLERIPSRDHMFRALWLQDHVNASLTRALERVLAASSHTPAHR